MRARAMYERHGWRRMSTSYKTMTDAELASACKRLQDLPAPYVVQFALEMMAQRKPDG